MGVNASLEHAVGCSLLRKEKVKGKRPASKPHRLGACDANKKSKSGDYFLAFRQLSSLSPLDQSSYYNDTLFGGRWKKQFKTNEPVWLSPFLPMRAVAHVQHSTPLRGTTETGRERRKFGKGKSRPLAIPYLFPPILSRRSIMPRRDPTPAGYPSTVARQSDRPARQFSRSINSVGLSPFPLCC